MINNFIEIFYPRCCYGCSGLLLEEEKYLCTKCLHELPITSYHLEDNNDIKNLFFGKITLEFCLSFLIFNKKGIVQNIIHNLKYKNNYEIGGFLGKWYGNILREKNDVMKIDTIIPVPLHSKKLKKRGYNQIELFARELADTLKIKYDDSILVRTENKESQTKKDRIKRNKNVKNIFKVIDDKINYIQNRHIAVVDDVVTTGHTLENCCKSIREVSNSKISIITICRASS